LLLHRHAILALIIVSFVLPAQWVVFLALDRGNPATRVVKSENLINNLTSQLPLRYIGGNKTRVEYPSVSLEVARLKLSVQPLINDSSTRWFRVWITTNLGYIVIGTRNAVSVTHFCDVPTTLNTSLSSLFAAQTPSSRSGTPTTLSAIIIEGNGITIEELRIDVMHTMTKPLLSDTVKAITMLLIGIFDLSLLAVGWWIVAKCHDES